MKKLSFLLLSILIAGQLFAQLKFKAETRSVTLGDSLKLSWKVQDIKKITNIRIKNLKENLAPEGSIYVKPEKSKAYRLEVLTSKKNKSYKKSTWIEVVKPEIISFKTVKQNNTDNDSTGITWKTENTEYVIIDNIKQKLPPKGKIKLLLDTTSFIHLKAYNTNGMYTEKELKIPILNVEYLRGEHSPYLYDTCEIKWQYKYCKYVKINGINKKFNPKDKLKLIALKDTTYYLNIYKENGDTLFKKFYVNVKSPLKKFYVPMIVYKGIEPQMSWDVKEGFFVKIYGATKVITDNKGIIKIPMDTTKKYTIIVKDYQGKIVESQTRHIVNIKSPIKKFELPEEAFVYVPTYIKWEVAPMFTARIEGLANTVSSKGKAKIIPVADKKYIIIASYKGKEVERIEKTLNVQRRRAYIKSIINYKDIDKDSKLNFEIFAIDESRYPDETKLYVMAVDDDGNFVSGLAKSNKHNQEKIVRTVIDKVGNKGKKIYNFKFREYKNIMSLPYDISLSLDYSGSMYGFIQHLEKSAHTFLSNKDKTDRIAIVRFDHRLAKVCDFEQNKDSLLTYFTMNGLDTLGGATALYAGSDFAMEPLKKSKNKKVLIIFTDGMENSSFSYYGRYAYTATQLAKKARLEDVTIHVIAYGSGVNNSVLQKLAYTTGGNFYKLKTTDDINKVFQELPIIFKNYYVISYKPVSKRGKHSVKIVYNNLQGKNYSTTSNYQVGEKFTIKEYDPTYKKLYWMKAADSLKKFPVSVPQAIAYFDFDKSILLDKYTKSIDTYIEYLNKSKKTTAVIFGHTDSKGSDKYCDALSLRRAKAVKKYMVEKGVDENRIYIKGCGKHEMIWKPEKEEWQAHENRRTEILLLN